MREIKPPNDLSTNDGLKIFLAGSIEMGKAEDWQNKIVKTLEDKKGTIFNPRRDNWDSSWKQSKDNPDFRQQVEWELEALSKSDYILMYFDPNTKSPISLLEMGLYARSGKLLVICPDSFWRKGNVDIVCEKYNVRQFPSIELALEYLSSVYKNGNQS